MNAFELDKPFVTRALQNGDIDYWTHALRPLFPRLKALDVLTPDGVTPTGVAVPDGSLAPKEMWVKSRACLASRASAPSRRSPPRSPCREPRQTGPGSNAAPSRGEKTPRPLTASVSLPECQLW